MAVLKDNNSFLLAINQSIDLLIVATAFWAAFLTRDLHLNSSKPYLFIFFIALTVCHISLRLSGIYGSFRRQNFLQIFIKINQACFTGIAGIIFLMYLLHMDAASRLFLGYFALYQILFLTTAKSAVYHTLLYYRNKDYNTRNVLIVGTKKRAVNLIAEINSNPASGYRIYGCLDTVDAKEKVGQIVSNSASVIGTMDDFKDLLLKKVIDEIIFALPLKKVENIHDYIFFAERIGINVSILPDFQIEKIMYRPDTAKLSIDSFLGTPTMSISSTPPRDSKLMAKTFTDYTIATLGIVLLSPLLLIIALLIKIHSRGPVFFTQTRSGLNGRDFTLYKFRTMVDNAEELKTDLSSTNEMDGPAFKMKKDPRITNLGHFLRKTSLDELPQLLNILRGEMSVVGPRPPLPSEVCQYRHWQRRKLSMKPGLTCIWQVSGRNNTTFEDWMKMDLEYIDNWSLLLDLKLIGQTAKEVLLAGGH